MHKEKISIIIPCYNVEKYLDSCVQSIINQTYKNLEIILVDDCSTDNTWKIIKQYEKKYDNIKALKNEKNSGAGYSRNRAVEIASNQYISFIDSDDYIELNFYETMLKQMKKEKADMVIGSRFIDKKGFQSSRTRRMGILYFTWLIKLFSHETITDPTSGLRMIGKDVIKMFAHNYPKDYPEPETAVAVLRSGKKIVEIPVIMRQRQGGVSSINMKNSIYYMIKVSLAIVIESFRSWH